jgi:RNA polymerase subunit RPABC4/transcription elongation factor Spt4
VFQGAFDVDILLWWFLFSVAAGIIAASKGRHGFGYFLLSMVLSPLIGLILTIALPSSAVAAVPAGPTPATHVKCPDCAEFILIEAKVCKHCGCRLVSGGVPDGKKQCPDCGRLNDASEEYCGVCGHSLH